MLSGIDVSHYQEQIDWPKVRASGVKFAIIKASEGTDYVDPMFEQNFKGALAAGIIPGSYHFFLPSLDPLKQAAHYSSVLEEVTMGRKCLPPCIDLETAGATKAQMSALVGGFMQEMQRLGGRSGLLYTSPGFWSTYLPVPVVNQYRLSPSPVDWAAAYPLWIAHYTTGWPSQIYPWVGWAFWQYSSAGKISGIPTRVDLDYFNGSLEDLEALAEKGIHA
jgi:lysozyme